MQMIAALLILLQAATLSPARASVAAGDTAFARMDYRSAIAAYEAGMRLEPDSAEALWRLARIHVIMSEATTSGVDEQMLRAAEEYARRAVRLNPRSAEARTWLAGTIGFLTLNAPVADQVRLSREILAETDTALSLDPSNDIVYSIRGSFYRALGNVGWLKKQLAALFLGSVPSGGYEESEQALLKAVALGPDVMRHRYELAVLYLDWGRNDEAKRALEDGQRLPVRVMSDVPRLKRIKLLLGQLQ